MIQYALKCAQGHTFDSWFQSAQAYDKLAAAHMVSCAICGGLDVDKAIMTPRVQNTRTKDQGTKGMLSQPATPAEQAMSELRHKVEENADYVGADFAQEARAIHDGDAPDRFIYGETRLDEARKLIEDGVPVSPLPFAPARKVN